MVSANGKRVAPIEGDEPCWFYEESGVGAGLEEDAMPQCARCGFKYSEHTKTWEQWCVALDKEAMSCEWCLEGFEEWRAYYEMGLSPSEALNLALKPLRDEL